MSDWRDGLTHKDWLFDGDTIRSERAIDRFNHLDWSKAWVDLGPSIAGNLGPYWHVPLDDGDTVYRLYPKVLMTKWVLLIQQACREYADRQVKGYWQPMILAPKDKNVLVVDRGQVSEAYYNGESDSWWLANTAGHDFDAADPIYPTWWQPMPEGPARTRPDVLQERPSHG